MPFYREELVEIFLLREGVELGEARHGLGMDLWVVGDDEIVILPLRE